MKKNIHPLNFLAFAISSLLSPYIVAAVFSAIIIYTYSRSLGEFLPWMLTFFFFAILIPGSYFLWQMETGKINDVHIANQNQRKIPFLIGGIAAVISSIILWFLDAARPVIVISVIYSVNALVVSLITQFWKISIHCAMYISIVTMAVILFGEQYWWLYLLIIPLAWSRIRRRRHSVWQTVAGSMVAFVLTTLVFWIFGYI